MYKALKSFSGAVSMAMGDVKDIKDQAIVEDLLKAGYIEPVKGAKKTEGKSEDKTEEKTAKPKAKK